MVAVIMVVPMTCATLGRAGQRTAQILGDEFLHQGARWAGSHFDTLLRKKVKGSPANAACDNRADTLPMQPAREYSGRVGRSRDRARGQDRFEFGIGVHELELGAAAEMAVEAAVSDRNGDSQVCIRRSYVCVHWMQ